jgi:predicted nucleic acid-binding protein
VIVIVTNVLSELLSPAPEPNVVAWVASKPRSALFTTTITRAEILHGIALMPEGKRRDALLPSVREIFDEDFSGQVLPFDSDAADCFATIASACRFDAMVAAVARSRGASLATRNGKDLVSPASAAARSRAIVSPATSGIGIQAR